MNRLQSVWASVRTRLTPRTLVLVVTLLLLIAVPVSLLAAQMQQDIRQEAAKKKNNKKNKAGGNVKKLTKKLEPEKPVERLADRMKAKRANQKKKDNNGNTKENKKNRKKDKNKKKNKKKRNRNNPTPSATPSGELTDPTDSDKDKDPGDKNKDPGEKDKDPGDKEEPTEPEDEEQQVERTFNLTILLDGIGRAGDVINPGSQGNSDPLLTQRDVFFDIYDEENDLVAELEGVVSYDTTSGSYKGTVKTPLLSGAYSAIIDLFNYPEEAVPGILNLPLLQTASGSANIIVPDVTFRAGDIDDDGEITLLDYNLLADCYNASEGGDAECFDEEAADLNSDGAVDLFDVNLLLRELSNYGRRRDTTTSQTQTAPPTPTPTPIN